MHKYEILDIIDEGAYGIVWKATNKQTQQLVAIKQFKETDEDEDSKRTIQRQIKMLKMLKGDYVVGIKEAFKKKGKIYLIFEYFPKNLLNIIEVFNEGLEPSLIKEIVYKVIKCLKFLHNKNILHRDVKPENILLNEGNQVLKLCDLGFARFIPEDAKSMTDYVATRWYRSPELLVGQPYGKPSDIFALGCIIGELVDGQPMFPGEDQIDQIFLLKKYIGQLTTVQHRYLFDNHKFSGLQIPELKKRQTLQERYLGKIQKNALLFMKACLKMDPLQRITVEEALKHPYLLELSQIDKEFQNDQLNLLKDDRKTVPKTELRASVMSLPKQEGETKNIQESIILAKNKSFSKAKDKLKINFGSVDYSNSKSYSNLNNFSSNQMLHKKSSHQNFLKHPEQESQSPYRKQQLTKSKHLLKKNMSQEKHLKVNFDVNVQINLKINKDNANRKIYETEHQNEQISNYKSHKLPELKHASNHSNSNSILHLNNNVPKGSNQRSMIGLAGINRRVGQRGNNLTIFGRSKQITKHLINKKLMGLVN